MGQSQKIIVRNSLGEFNVAGLEIENCYFADVYDNTLTNNTGGLLVFDLPDLPQQGGHDIRMFHNTSTEGNIVGLVAAGKGSGHLHFDVVPGAPEASILVYRMTSTDPGAMLPEIGRSVVHLEGVDLIRAWIAGLKG